MTNEVELRVDGENFKFWDTLEINRPLDSIDTFSLSAPFDPDVPLLRRTFVPLSYKDVELKIDGDPLLAGKLFVTPQLNPSSNIVTCSGYSKPGVLNDCEFPPDTDSLEFNDVTLQTIAESAAAGFGLDVIFNDPPGVVFDQVAAGRSTKVLTFLIKLAKQRGLLLSNTLPGELLFFKPIESGAAVAAIHSDQDRFLTGKPVFNDQQYFSSITGMSPNVIARFSESFTVDNSLLPGVTRPHTFTISDTTDVDIQDVIKDKMGRMIASAIAYEIAVQGWRDDNGDLWAPNTIVKLFAPGIMVYNETDMIVKSVRLSRASEGGDTATLKLVLPGAYNGKIPERLPWQDS